MFNRLSVVIALFLLVTLMAPACFASVFSYTISPSDLDHGSAYYWGLSHFLNPGETIIGASILFNNINNWAIEDDVMYVRLFQNADYGIKTKKLNDNKSGDYFKGKGRHLVDYSDENEYRYKIWNKKHTKWWWSSWKNPSEDFTYYFNDYDIDALNDAMSDGKFAFGIDPDCRYSTGGITFEFETTTTPEPSTLLLLGLGLGLRGRFRKIGKGKGKDAGLVVG